MKKCSECGFQDREELNFCRECGGMMRNIPQMVVPLDEIAGEKPGELITEEFSAETETVVGNRFQASVTTLSTQIPQNKKLIFAVFGGLFAVVVVIAAAVVGLVYFYFQNTNTSAKVRSTPVLTASKPTASQTPKPSPTGTPEENPTESTEDEDDVIFPAPKNPTRKGSFRIEGDTDKWQLSEIETVGSEKFQTTVRGTLVLDGINSDNSPDGVETNKDRRIYKQYRTGALLMRTKFANGKASNIQPVTASDVWENDRNETGRIEFLINDNSPEENEGGFVVSVEMLKVKK